MNNVYLTEAFKELNLLNEEAFDLDDESKADIKELITQEDDVIDIIDDEAADEEELEDSYVGKVILDCCVCHSKIYKDADSVVINQDAELANEDEECPYCYSTEGYKIIGQIAPYEEKAELEVEVEDKDVDGDVDEVEVREDDIVEESCDKNCADCKECKDKADDSVKESFEKVELETEDKVIKISEEEKEADEASGEEVIVPLDIEAKKEIVDATDEEEGYSDELIADEEAEDELDDASGEEFVDQDFDEFEEEDFDELGEGYLKKVYENVDSFKTSKVSTKGNLLKLEGIIKFNSGNEKATTFLFEAKDITKKGKMRFIGENKQITRGKKAFTLTGKVDNNKLMVESLNYNYQTKDANGKSVRLYGTIKR